MTTIDRKKLRQLHERESAASSPTILTRALYQRPILLSAAFL